MADALVYASKLARLPVLDPEGAAVGQVDDIVVGPAGVGHAPPVIGFVLAVPGRRIFLSAGRVAAIEPEGLRLRTPTVNLRRFAPRPSETEVLHQLLDRRLPGGIEAVNDVALRHSGVRGRTWEVASVDVVPARRRLRSRRTPRRTAPWQEVRELFGEGPGRWEHLRDLHPADLASRLRELDDTQRAEAARTLDDEHLADLLEELPEDIQAQLLAGLGLERAADVLESMDPDDAADLLGELTGVRRGELLAAMEPDEAEPVRRLLNYAADTAGGLMTPEPVILPPSATVAEALALLRDPDLPPALAAQVFVTQPPAETPTGPFLGTASLQRLLREPPSEPVADCLEEGPAPVAPELADREVAERLATYDLLAVPVCDAGGRLVGAVTVDDVLDRLLPADWRTH